MLQVRVYNADETSLLSKSHFKIAGYIFLMISLRTFALYSERKYAIKIYWKRFTHHTSKMSFDSYYYLQVKMKRFSLYMCHEWINQTTRSKIRANNAVWFIEIELSDMNVFGEVLYEILDIE